MQNQGRHKRGLPFVREAVGYNEFVLPALTLACCRRRVGQLCRAGWRCCWAWAGARGCRRSKRATRQTGRTASQPRTETRGDWREYGSRQSICADARSYDHQRLDTKPPVTFEKNMQWVRQIIAEGREVIDIGPDFLRRASTGRASGVYEMERRLLKGYPNYVRDFQRWHRLQGGNPYVDPWVHFLRTAGQP